MRKTAKAAALMASLALLCVPSVAAANPAAGPEISNCAALKKKGTTAAFRACLEENQANRLAFNQIKNSRFVGTRGDGEEIDAIYCANGKFESRASGSTGTGISSGGSWRVDGATVRQGGKWIDAFIEGEGGLEVAVQRRGAVWKLGIASLGRILYPGEMEKSAAAGDCATLSV